MRKLQIILLALGIAFFGWLLWEIDVREVWRKLVMLGWGLIPLMLGEGIAEMIHTLGWRHCLSRPLQALPWLTLFRIRMAGYAINYLTPTAALGGEVTRASLLASHDRASEAASGVLIGKVCFGLAHLLFVTLGALLVLWRVQMPGALWAAMLACGALVGGGMITFLLLQKHGKVGVVVRWLAARQPENQALQQAARNLTSVDNALRSFYRERPSGVPLAIAWHLLGYSVGILQTWFFFRLLHLNAGWTMAAGLWFLGMWFDLLTFAVPLNLGTLEGTRIVALQAIGYTALMGMTYGFALRLAQVFWACFGLANHAMLAARAPKSAMARADQVPGEVDGKAQTTVSSADVFGADAKIQRERR